MIRFVATLLKFEKNAEKTGWTFLELTRAQADKLIPGQKVSFRIRGKLDSCAFEKTALLPDGAGGFILPVNAAMRKEIGKKHGDKVKVELEVDKRQPEAPADLIVSLKDEPGTLEYFKSLPKSHQNYFIKWIDSAKTATTKTKRIVMTVIAMSEKKDFGQMIRDSRKDSY